MAQAQTPTPKADPWAVVSSTPLAPDDPWAVVTTKPLDPVQAEIAKFRQSQLDAGPLLGAATRGVLQTINPIPLVKEIANRGLVGTAQDALDAQGRVGQQAASDFKAGRYVDAARHGLAYLIPLLGPAVSLAGDKLADALHTGDTLKVAEAIGNHLGFAAPQVLQGRGVTVVKKPVTLTPEVQAAVNFGTAQGVPLDAGTVTGSQFVKNAQSGVAATPLGAFVTEGVQKRQATAMRSAGDRLAARVSPNPMTPEAAGTRATASVQGEVSGATASADTAYTTLRTLEAAQKDNPSARVDMTSAKARLVPVYDQLSRLAAPAKLAMSDGFASLKAIIEGPKYLSVSDADMLLSGIKRLARNAENLSANKGLTQAVAAQMDAAVMKGAATLGPDAVAALKAGRQATIRKYAASDVLDTLNKEPVKAFRDATTAQDTAIVHLRELEQFAPDAPKEIGRAWLDQALAKAGEQGGFAHADKLYADWQKLGTETKAKLFGPSVPDLNNFFLLAKKLAEQPNPSGTARTLISHAQTGGAAALMLTEPVTGAALVLSPYVMAKLLYSPRMVRALNRGMTIPLASKNASVSAMSAILQVAKAEGLSLSPQVALGPAPPPR